MKTGLKIALAVIITFFVTLYAVYLLQSRNITASLSESKAGNTPTFHVDVIEYDFWTWVNESLNGGYGHGGDLLIEGDPNR